MITSAINDRTLCIEFDDPSSRNSFSLRAARGLKAALQSGSYDSIIFRASGRFSGRVFCSGGNLADYAAMTTPEPGLLVNREITEILQQISQISTPTFCLVSGDCFGGGLELMTAFDFIYTSPNVVFGFWQRKIALTFGWGGGARIESRVGEQKTRQLALAASVIGAREALNIGLVDELHPTEKLIEAAQRKIQSLRQLPIAPLASLKSDSSPPDASLTEQEKFEALWWNPEHQKVLASRKPK
jgi:enoyl-CoA hydratase